MDCREAVAKEGDKPVLSATPADRALLKTLITQELNLTERMVVLLHYHQRMTPAEIGLTLGISEIQVAQVREAVVRRARALIEVE